MKSSLSFAPFSTIDHRVEQHRHSNHRRCRERWRRSSSCPQLRRLLWPILFFLCREEREGRHRSTFALLISFFPSQLRFASIILIIDPMFPGGPASIPFRSTSFASSAQAVGAVSSLCSSSSTCRSATGVATVRGYDDDDIRRFDL